MIRILIVAFSLVAAGTGHAADRPKLAPVLGGVIDLSSPMTDENGNLQSLGALANGKPTLILLGYHRCKNLCGFAERDLAENLISTHLPPDAYSVVFASVDPYETTGDAQASKATLALAAPNADLSRWRFVTMDSVTSARLEKALGVSVLSMNRDIYVHPVAIAAVTASGRLSGMLSGLDYTPRELRLAIVAASQNRLGTLGDRILLLCSALVGAGRYTNVVMLSLRIAGAAATAGLCGSIFLMTRRSRR